MALSDVTNAPQPGLAVDTQQQQAQEAQEAKKPLSPIEAKQLKDRQDRSLKRMYESQAEDMSKERAMKRFADSKDTTGTEEGDSAHTGLQQAAAAQGLPVVSKSQTKHMAARVHGNADPEQLTQGIKSALLGEGPIPSADQIAGAATKALGATGGLGAAGSLPAQDQLGQKIGGSKGLAAGETTAASPGEGQNKISVPTPRMLGEPLPGTVNDPEASKVSGSEKAFSDQLQDIADGKAESSSVATSVIGFIMAVMMKAQIEGNKDKKQVLNHIKMCNGQLDAINDYVQNTLMPAQDQLTQKIHDSKDKSKATTTSVMVDGVASNMDTDMADVDANGKVQARFTYDQNGGRKLMDSQSLQANLSTADQWRTSVNNKQQRQSNRFQSIDNNQSSQMNIINALLKNTHDAVTAIVRNTQN